MSKQAQDLTHKWAHGLNDKQYSRVPVYVENGTLFSYGRHFPLGVRCGTIAGKPAYLLNSRSYSLTTSTHQRDASWATQHGERLRVPMFAAPWSSMFIPQMVEQMERDQQTAERDTASRGPVKRERALLTAQGIADTAKRLPAFLKGAGLKLDRSNAARLRKLAAWVPCDREQLAERLKAAKLAQERREARAKAKAMKAEAERLERWKMGEGWGGFTRLALRLKDGEVETTKGARVDEASARRLWMGWKAGVDMVGRHVGPYQVNEQTPDAIRIGCHTIDRATAEEFVARVGW